MIDAAQSEINQQRSACLQYAEKHGWTVLREFWAEEDHMNQPINTDDPLTELRAGAEKEKV